jgi:hypothetical protein
MVDDQDEVDEFEFEDSESLKDRVRRGPILGVLLGTTLFAGAVWVVVNSSIAYTVFLVSLGSYIVL